MNLHTRLNLPPFQTLWIEILLQVMIVLLALLLWRYTMLPRWLQPDTLAVVQPHPCVLS
jgi:hypothetical protein